MLVMIIYTEKPRNNGHARDVPSLLYFVGRLSSFGGYFVWSVYRRELLDVLCREVVLFRRVLLWSVYRRELLDCPL